MILKKGKNLPLNIEEFRVSNSDIYKFIERIKEFLKFTENLKRKSENDFFKKLYGFLVQIDRMTYKIKDKNLQHIVKEDFRESVKKYIIKSPLCKHGLLKPKKYPGDFKIIEAVYNEKPFANENTIGYLFDQFLLKTDYVQAVRDRKSRMRDLLKLYLKNNKQDEVKILNIACGSCRDIRELLNEGIVTTKKVHFVLIDQDKECLEFAKKCLKGYPSNFYFSFIQSNVYSFFRNDEFLKKFGKFDYIYSIGLADYLSDIVLGDMIQKGYQRLTPKGKLIIAHKNVRKFNSVSSDWICDWNFIPRDKSEIVKMINKKLARSNISVHFEYIKSKLIFFFAIEKNIAS